MRTLLTLALCAAALVFVSCDESPTSSQTITIGETTIEKMLTQPGYRAWYDPGYSAYPDAASQRVFDSSVAVIRAAFTPGVHKVVMAIKPNCGCQTTQLWMPRVMKTLDAAGIPHENLEIFVTDTRLTGIDTLERKYSYDIKAAPVFLVVRGTSVMATVDPIELAPNRTIEQDLAAGFAKP